MKILLIAPKEEPKVKEIDDTLEAMKEEVEGYIETVHPFTTNDIVLVCNEEDKLKETPLNRIIHFPYLKDYIYGTFFFCGERTDEDGEREMCSLTDRQIEALLNEIEISTAVPLNLEAK